MQYKKIDANHILVRLFRGEEIMASLLKVAEEAEISFAMIQGLGAVDEAVLGLYDVTTKEYTETALHGVFEVISLTGSLDKMDGKHYGHVHIALGTTAGKTYGGHMVSGRIGITGEIVLTLLGGEVNRIRDEELGINVWDLRKE